MLAVVVAGCGGSSGGASDEREDELLLPPPSGRGMGPPGPGNLTAADARVLGLVEPDATTRRYAVPVVRGAEVSVRPVCGTGVEDDEREPVRIRWNGHARDVTCRGAPAGSTLGAGDDANVIEIEPFRPSQAIRLIVSQQLPTGVAVVSTRDEEHRPPERSVQGPREVEILPDDDPNAIRRVTRRIGSGDRLEVATNAPGTLVVLIDGHPVDLVGEAGRPSMSGVWVSNTTMTPRGSLTQDEVFAGLPDRDRDDAVEVTVIPQHFAVPGWRVSIG